ncbi:nickel pincer cofactor biosynthesis protein LarC [Candidatus Auribacterota bacterium]
MKTAYMDCIGGASGDMIVGALLDAGMPLAYLKRELSKLAVPGYSLRVSREKRGGISGVRFDVRLKEKIRKPKRSYSDIKRLLLKSGLKESVKKDSIEIFRIIAHAEAGVHDQPPEQVHFHEVGAVDSIVDIVGASIGFDYFGFEMTCASAMPLGSGLVACEHGVFPAPAPATVRILEGVPVRRTNVEGEMVTPTGAAILKYYVSKYGRSNEFIVKKSGYGLGKNDLKSVPNITRLLLGESVEDRSESNDIKLIETNIDDMNPQIYGYLVQKLFAAGALDVWLTPITMKKMRPATMLSVMAGPDDLQSITSQIFAETTTLGVRITNSARVVLERKKETVKTKYGTINVKIGSRAGSVANVSPEYEECRKLAEKKKVPLKQVMKSALDAYRKRDK